MLTKALAILTLALIWIAYQVWAFPIPIAWSSTPVAVVHVSFAWGFHRYALYPQDGNRCRVAFRGLGCAGTYGQTGSIPYDEARDFYWELRRRFSRRAWTNEKDTVARVLVGREEWRGELTESDGAWLHSTWCAREAARWDLESLHGPIPQIWVPAWEAAPHPSDFS